MKRIWVVIAVLAVVAGSASAEWRADIRFDVPWRIGITFEDAEGESATESINVLQHGTILLPNVIVGYGTQLGPVSAGVGARLFTLIIQSMVYPVGFAEIGVGSIAINFNVGGGLFGFFGLHNSLETASIVVPDLSAYFKIGRSFRLGLGGLMMLGFGEDEQDGVPHLLYISGMFATRF